MPDAQPPVVREQLAAEVLEALHLARGHRLVEAAEQVGAGATTARRPDVVVLQLVDEGAAALRRQRTQHPGEGAGQGRGVGERVGRVETRLGRVRVDEEHDAPHRAVGRHPLDRLDRRPRGGVRERAAVDDEARPVAGGEDVAPVLDDVTHVGTQVGGLCRGARHGPLERGHRHERRLEREREARRPAGRERQLGGGVADPRRPNGSSPSFGVDRALPVEPGAVHRLRQPLAEGVDGDLLVAVAAPSSSS